MLMRKRRRDAVFDYVDVSENGTAMEVDGEDDSTTPVTTTNGFAKWRCEGGIADPWRRRRQTFANVACHGEIPTRAERRACLWAEAPI